MNPFQISASRDESSSYNPSHNTPSGQPSGDRSQQTYPNVLSGHPHHDGSYLERFEAVGEYSHRHRLPTDQVEFVQDTLPSTSAHSTSSMPSPGYARLKGSSLKFWNFKPSGHTTGVDTAKFSKGLVNRATQPTTVQTSQCARGTEEQLAWLGYKQELFRDWDFWASFSLSCANIGLVPGSIWGLYSAISFGGPVIMLWGYFLSMIFMCCLNAVLAEMSSAYPVTGAMFTWTFKLAKAHPKLRDWARLLSWIVGFLLCVSHVLIQVQVAAQFVVVLTSAFTASGYTWSVPVWQRYLLICAWLILCGLIACTATARSPITWKIVGVMNALACITLCITLLATAENQRPFKDLFTQFENRTTFKSNVWVFILGAAQSTLFVGSEPAAHMAEETKSAASTVPRVIFWSIFSSYFAGFAVIISITKTLVPGHRHTPRTWAMVDLIYLHCPKPAAHLVIVCLIFTMALSDISQILAASRFFWALARDSAIPFAPYWRQISTAHRIPRKATALLVVVSICTASMVFEPTNTLTTILTQGAPVFISVCYMVPLVLYVSGEKGVMDRDGRNVWTLRAYSIPLSWVSLAFLLGIVVIFSSPTSSHIDATTWSWSLPVLVVMIIFALATWLLYGKSHYAGPIKSLTVWTTGGEVEMPKKMARILVPDVVETVNPILPDKNQSSVLLIRGHPEQTSIAINSTCSVPGTYVSYTSEGSMWCDTNPQSQHILE